MRLLQLKKEALKHGEFEQMIKTALQLEHGSSPDRGK
jgi:hypothetical protein